MTPLIAPFALAAGAGAAAPIGATVAAASSATAAALAVKPLIPILSGVSALSAAKGQKELAEQNAYIGRTRAIQTNASARESLNSELATLRATFAANQQRPGVGTDQVFRELRQARSRERRIEFGNEMQQAAQSRLQGQNAIAAGRGELLGGFIKAGPSLFDLAEWREKQRLARA